LEKADVFSAYPIVLKPGESLDITYKAVVKIKNTTDEDIELLKKDVVMAINKEKIQEY
jgi:hypothetical protein